MILEAKMVLAQSKVLSKGKRQSHSVTTKWLCLKIRHWCSNDKELHTQGSHLDAAVRSAVGGH